MPDDHASSPSQCRSATAGDGRRGGSACCCRCRCPRRSIIWPRRAHRRPSPAPLCACRSGSAASPAWSGTGRATSFRVERLKPIIETLPAPRAAARAAPLCRARRRLHDGAARRGAAHDDERPRGAAAAAPAAALRGLPGRHRGTRRTAKRKAPDRRRGGGCSSCLRDGPPMTAAELARLAGCGAGRRSRPRCRGPRRGAIRPGRAARNRRRPTGACPARRSRPTSRPRRSGWSASVEAGGFAVTVLDGVTGSGKTETYFAALAAALAAGTAGPGAAAGDRPRRAVARALPRALRRRFRRNGTPISARPSAATPGGPSPPAGRGSSSAPARRCSCLSPSSA